MSGPAARPTSALPAALALFGSLATLICCALPAVLVSLGLGAVMAGLYAAVPQASLIGQHKVAIFAVAGALLAGAAWSFWRARNSPCPADPGQAAACARMRKLSAVTLGIAGGLYGVGVFFAFLVSRLFF